MRGIRGVSTAAMLLWGCVVAWSAAPAVDVKWGELEARVVGKKTALVLPDGATVEGKVRGVQADGLRMDIRKSSDRQAHPKGPALIPRASVSALRVTEYGWAGRLLCSVGAAAVVGGAAVAAGTHIEEGLGVVLVPVFGSVGAAGAGIGGYYVGKRIDRRVTEIRIAPGD